MFSLAMSRLYRSEVPQYGALIDLVADVNGSYLCEHPDHAAELALNDELNRISLERHGAIRLGTAEELHNIRRLFAVMGMQPVGYYDLSVAGIPVHATAFRPVSDASLRVNPFRVFTSLLRLDLIEDDALRQLASQILARRQIFSPRTLELIAVFEANGGLTSIEADELVREAIKTFGWHSHAIVDLETYRQLHQAHRLVADVVSFRGPHINHLTPRTLDIDKAQAEMPRRGIAPKAVIEGPPLRNCPILLRQTSFKALEEQIVFTASRAGDATGKHTARFGEIEQRGAALTPAGRALYDQLLTAVRKETHVGSDGDNACSYEERLAQVFVAFPDDWSTLRKRGLAYFRYAATPAGIAAGESGSLPPTTEELIDQGYLSFSPIIYEDFLPVSAAGIFQSNLGTDEQRNHLSSSNRELFERALGVKVKNEIELYADAQRDSLDRAFEQLHVPKPVGTNAI